MLQYTAKLQEVFWNYTIYKSTFVYFMIPIALNVN